MRGRAYRRHQAQRHMERRVKELKQLRFVCDIVEYRYKEQPQACSGLCCGNQRRYESPTIQERRHA